MVGLRQATGTEHARAEALLDLSAMTSSLDAYAAGLLCFQRLHAFVMTNTTDVVATAPVDLRAGLPRGRARVAADLAALEQMTGAEHVGLPEPTRLADLADPDAQLGAWYVLEGSALGGRVIARHVRHSLPHAADAMTYVTGEGAGTAARWRRFGTWVDELDTVDVDAVHRGALRTFAYFCALLSDA